MTGTQHGAHGGEGQQPLSAAGGSGAPGTSASDHPLPDDGTPLR